MLSTWGREHKTKTGFPWHEKLTACRKGSAGHGIFACSAHSENALIVEEFGLWAYPALAAVFCSVSACKGWQQIPTATRQTASWGLV